MAGGKVDIIMSTIVGAMVELPVFSGHRIAWFGAQPQTRSDSRHPDGCGGVLDCRTRRCTPLFPAQRCPVGVDSHLDTLFLQAPEEGLGHGIIPAVASPAHAGFQVIGSTEAPPGIAAILGALIRMDQSVPGSPASHCLPERLQNKFTMDRWLRSPADNFPGEEIHDHGQVQPALPRPYVGDIRYHPHGIASRHGELTL